MRVEVVDASALAALYFGEPEADIVARQLVTHNSWLQP